MGAAKQRGTYAERKATPNGRNTKTKKLHGGKSLLRYAKDLMTRDELVAVMAARRAEGKAK